METTAAIHPKTTVGLVSLTVRDLSRSLPYYESLGLHMHRQADGAVWLGDGAADLLHLVENPAARTVSRHTGLYHFALLLPTRRDLALALANIAHRRLPMQGYSDHLVSEALYLADPDDNGIEIYRDRPRAEWPQQNGRLQMDTLPLNVQDLMATIDGTEATWSGIPAGTTMGHVHLHVNDLDAAAQFYVQTLGFDVVMRYGPSALFVSAGGYHHHIGLNTWAGRGAPPPPPDAVGLRWYTVQLPDQDALTAVLDRLHRANVPVQEQENGYLVRDPAQNGIILSV